MAATAVPGRPLLAIAVRVARDGVRPPLRRVLLGPAGPRRGDRHLAIRRRRLRDERAGVRVDERRLHERTADVEAEEEARHAAILRSRRA